MTVRMFQQQTQTEAMMTLVLGGYRQLGNKNTDEVLYFFWL